VIKTSITFVVGAGASTIYKLPMGSGLKQRAIDLTRDASNDVYRLVKAANSRSIPCFALSRNPDTSSFKLMMRLLARSILARQLSNG